MMWHSLVLEIREKKAPGQRKEKTVILLLTLTKHSSIIRVARLTQFLKFILMIELMQQRKNTKNTI